MDRKMYGGNICAARPLERMETQMGLCSALFSQRQGSRTGTNSDGFLVTKIDLVDQVNGRFHRWDHKYKPLQNAGKIKSILHRGSLSIEIAHESSWKKCGENASMEAPGTLISHIRLGDFVIIRTHLNSRTSNQYKPKNSLELAVLKQRLTSLRSTIYPYALVISDMWAQGTQPSHLRMFFTRPCFCFVIGANSEFKSTRQYAKLSDYLPTYIGKNTQETYTQQARE